MKNRDVFQRDPLTAKLLNDGVAAVGEGSTEKEVRALRYELEHFVCEGQYEDGVIRILESYLGSVDSTTQPAAWVSGFYGSGKSHLLKMLRHLWVDTRFDEDGATARGLAQIPQEVRDLLRELDTLGKRCGGLHAASGTLPSGGGESVRLAVLSVILRSSGLPESLPQAQFCLWLKKNGILDQVQGEVQSQGRGFMNELHDLYVSPVLAQALLAADHNFAPDLKQVRASLREQFPVVEDLPTSDFIRIAREVLSVDGQIACTLIALDEIQLFIGDSATRSTDVQEVAEALCKQLDSRVMLIGAGQTALAGSIPLLQRLVGRFTIPVELSDADVETVTRRVVLAKKADKRKAIEEVLDTHRGEIDRQLQGTRIAPRSDDQDVMVDDYPLLPARRRFWESALRAVDVPGTSSQLRTQLRIVYEAVRDIATEDLGTVVAADVIFEQLQPDLLRSGVLLREIDETIRHLDDGSEEGRLAKRVCGLIFLIRKLSRDPAADIGLRATPETLADLLVRDLSSEGTHLRKEIPRILDGLVESGKLIKLDDEYSLQTRESSEWDREFRNHATRLNNDLTTLSAKRTELINRACHQALHGLKLLQGECKEPRKLAMHFGAESPPDPGREIPVWIRDGWGDSEGTVLGDARAADSDSPLIFVFIPKVSAEDLRKAIVEFEAARTTLDFRSGPARLEGREENEIAEARAAMESRKRSAEASRDQIIREVLDRAKVLQAGGNERFEILLADKVQAAAEASLDRMFPRFRDADDARWSSVISRAKNGDEDALQAVDWKDRVENHPVCAAVLAEVGPGERGRDVRAALEAGPYGWPRDSIDGAAILLFTCGNLRATHKGGVLTRGELDQNKIPTTEFRVETSILDAPQRIQLRKLFQNAGIACAPNQELVKAVEFLARLAELADTAGGNPPLPPHPETEQLATLRAQGGNEQLLGILKHQEALEKQRLQWAHNAELAEKRLPSWRRLEALLDQAGGLPEAAEWQAQAGAIREERRLLESTDPIGPIRKAVSELLRKTLTRAHQQLCDVQAQQIETLAASPTWGQLSEDEQQAILSKENISPIKPLSIGDEDALVQTLEATRLDAWQTLSDALPERFARAAVAAARAREPKMQTVRLTSGTLKTEEDVKSWVAETEAKLVGRLKDGPVVVS